ncbi:unnamed protein product [Amoebophrya sp. A120]|nr:unnamed protein product [Amoebophrya sp. A120]|eukprot:GSA120T00012752001.1
MAAAVASGMSTVVEFRAGKMNWDGRMCTADKRKGKVQLVKDAEDLHHVLWWDRDKNEKIDDYVVVQDAYLERVRKCTTGRVYVLKYTSSSVRVFFWMQEPKDDKDDELIKKFNTTIGTEIPLATQIAATIPQPATSSAMAATAAVPAAAPPANQAALQAQLLALLQNAGGQLQNVDQSRKSRVTLNSMLKADVLLTLAEDSEALAELKTHMPKDQQEDQDVIDTMHSPQLKENMKVLTQAIYSDQLPVLFTMMGLAQGPNMNEDLMETLVKALEATHKRD